MKVLVRRFLSLFLSQYEIYRIYRADPESNAERTNVIQLDVITDASALCNSDSPILRRLGQWGGDEATGFMLSDARKIIGACWYWHCERYMRDRHFWPLTAGDAKLVEIGVREDLRGAGHATRIIAASTTQMFGMGWKRLFARVWHNHTASLRAFEKAGWRNVALVLTLRVRGLNKIYRLECTHRSVLRGKSTKQATKN